MTLLHEETTRPDSFTTHYLRATMEPKIPAYAKLQTERLMRSYKHCATAMVKLEGDYYLDADVAARQGVKPFEAIDRTVCMNLIPAKDGGKAVIIRNPVDKTVLIIMLSIGTEAELNKIDDSPLMKSVRKLWPTTVDTHTTAYFVLNKMETLSPYFDRPLFVKLIREFYDDV